jgi:hypothetical protein
VAGEGQGRETGFLDDDAELLAKLADQRLLRPLARLDLAAGKLPKTCERLAGRIRLSGSTRAQAATKTSLRVMAEPLLADRS